MNGYNFTERVRKVLAMAREEAARLRHEYVGTEHILLGLIREGEGVAAAVLQNLSVDLEDIQQRIEETVVRDYVPEDEYREGLARAAREGWEGVFVLGDPAYYGRFGFTAEGFAGDGAPSLEPPE